VNELLEPYLTKSHECLLGAESELANNRYNNAANRVYYAAYNAAIVSLIRAGFNSRNGRWDHDEVQAMFPRELIHRRKIFPAAFRGLLRDLFDIRLRADYGPRLVSRALVDGALRDARRLISAIL
jgi:uncharacterized protein (UPF0332 family)